MRILVVALVAGCTASASPDAAPTLAIDLPVRGTTVSDSSVTVAGHATGTGVRVTVAGTEVTVAADGSFTATVTPGDGIDVIETHATDTAGHDVRDVRAVLGGTLATSDGTHAAPIGAHASATALATIGKAMANDVKAIDYTAVAQTLNPVYNNGGCLGAVIDISSISLSGADISLVPAAGALATNITIDNVVVKLHADYQLLCIGGSTTITVSASAAHLGGNLGVAVTSGKLVTSLPSASVVLDNFDLQVSGVPSQIVDLFDSVVRGKVESALASAIQNKVPPIANATLAGMLRKPVDATVLGEATVVSVTPTAATIAATGLYVGVDTKVLVTGGTSGMYVVEQTTPASATLSAQTRNLGVAIANDVVNQLFAGLWAAGAFDKTVPVASIGVLASLLDPDATKLALKLSLPPTITSDGTGNVQLAVGDAIISMQDDAGEQLQQIALSVQTGLAAQAESGVFAMSLGTPIVKAQVLGQVDDGSRPLTDAQVEGIVTGVWGVLAQQASDALAKLPLPAIAGVKLGAPTIGAAGNYVLADLPLQ